MKELNNLIKKLRENPKTRSKRTIEEIISIENNGKEMITIYLQRRYAEFHGNLDQTAPSYPELIPLINYIKDKNYTSNLK